MRRAYGRGVPTLLLLNGPSGVGKSTLAALWAREADAACLDPDRLRADLPEAASTAAMQAARARTLELAATALSNGRDVVVAQLCARPEFPDALRETAIRAQANYVEVLLVDSVAHLRRRLAQRATSAEAHHRLAHAALDLDELESVHAALVDRAAADPRVEVLRCGEGQEDITLRAIDQLVTTAAVPHAPTKRAPG
ncbi:AAA domain-containing protein [Barrientosiimonas humi]|uniref:AAA domain-containing protein n=1 Tax=Barrientosiimonas humi TaxID=999931 RepID=A0A542X9Y8_9MICO|nr:AAA domain-containing protein [Barrientosiimonas humi]CAG7572653.1 Guanylate kinase [Barrientosiimonas humi]